MCGIIGIVGNTPVNQSLYDGLTVLQHRGQDAAGIMTCDDGRLYLRKDNGLARDVFVPVAARLIRQRLQHEVQMRFHRLACRGNARRDGAFVRPHEVVPWQGKRIGYWTLEHWH